MFRRLFRLFLLFLILFFVNKYTTWFDNTKFGNFFNRIDTRISAIRHKWTNKPNDISSIQNESSNDDLSNANSFSNDDIIPSPQDTTIKTPIPWVSNIAYKPADYNIIIVDRNSKRDCITPRGQNVEDGNYIVAYLAPVNPQCVFEKRYCNNGILDWSYVYHTCLYSDIAQAQSKLSDLTSQDISALIEKKIFTYQEPEFFLSSDRLDKIDLDTNLSKSIDIKDIDTQTTVWPGIVASSYARKYAEAIQTNQTSLNGINSTNNDPDTHFLGRGEKTIDITKDNQTYLEDNVLKTKTLRSILKTGWPNYDSRYVELPPSSAPVQKICTTPWWDILSNGQYTLAFAQSSVSFPQSCQSEIRYCLDGVLKWSYNYNDCVYSGNTIEITITSNGTGYEWEDYDYEYSKNSIRYTYQLLDYYGRYTHTILKPITTYQYIPNQGQGCRHENFGIVPDGASVIWFESMVARDGGCIWQVRYCKDGELQGWYPYGYCE